jgi:hypothetical protein
MRTRFRAGACLLVLLTAVAGGLSADEPRPAEQERAGTFELAKTPLPGLISDADRLHRPSNHERLEVLKSLLKERKLDFVVRHFVGDTDDDGSSIQGDNVVLTFGSGDRILVVGAHFDAAQLPDGRIGPGAVDNAAGVVVLVRLAEAIKNHRFNHRVHVLFFDGEESGQVGSEQYARSLEPDRVEAMINVDVVAYGDTVIFGPTIGNEQDQLARALRSVCSRLSLDCFVTPRLPKGDWRSFQSRGVPSISVAFLPADEAHQVWLMFNRREQSGLREDFAPLVARLLHTSNDTADKLDPATMTQAFNLVGNLLLELDRWYCQVKVIGALSGPSVVDR